MTLSLVVPAVAPDQSRKIGSIRIECPYFKYVPRSALEPQALARRFQAGESIEQLAAQCQRSIQFIRLRLETAGVKLPPKPYVPRPSQRRKAEAAQAEHTADEGQFGAESTEWARMMHPFRVAAAKRLQEVRGFPLWLIAQFMRLPEPTVKGLLAEAQLMLA